MEDPELESEEGLAELNRKPEDSEAHLEDAILTAPSLSSHILNRSIQRGFVITLQPLM